jgi:hypothetical protein
MAAVACGTYRLSCFARPLLPLQQPPHRRQHAYISLSPPLRHPPTSFACCVFVLLLLLPHARLPRPPSAAKSCPASARTCPPQGQALDRTLRSQKFNHVLTDYFRRKLPVARPARAGARGRACVGVGTGAPGPAAGGERCLRRCWRWRWWWCRWRWCPQVAVVQVVVVPPQRPRRRAAVRVSVGGRRPVARGAVRGCGCGGRADRVPPLHRHHWCHCQGRGAVGARARPWRRVPHWLCARRSAHRTREPGAAAGVWWGRVQVPNPRS